VLAKTITAIKIVAQTVVKMAEEAGSLPLRYQIMNNATTKSKDFVINVVS
jgi:hypothetical protein